MPPRSKQPPAEPAPPAPAARRPERRRAPRKVPVDVVAVLVAHEGAQWLPEVLTALRTSTRTPRRILCVDTGSTDGSAELMREAYGDVLQLPPTTGYGEAVAAALATVEPADPPLRWVWLLHDDVAVEPTTLEKLLEHAESSPSAALLGPKVRDWHDPRYLVEVGLTTDAAGHRDTGLEHREQDQGQHDAVRDVLAVGTAAALVRRDAWDEVGGLDPHLRVFRDDLDLGWRLNAAGHRVVVVPQARVRHARAATTGQRPLHAEPGRASGTDRRHALYVLLAHASALRLLTLLPTLLVVTALRSLGLLLTRQPLSAADEWRALLGNLGHPARLHRARRARAATRSVPQRQLRPLLSSRAHRLRARAAMVADWLSRGAPVAAGGGALGDPGSDSGDFDELPQARGSILRALLLRPAVLLLIGLALLALLAERSLLWLHGGVLHGGVLLAPPAGADDLWSSYQAGWHHVGTGTAAPAPPATGLLALLSTLALGKPWLVVDVLLLGCVPLAGLSAYLAGGRLVRHLSLRLWVAVTWAVLPVATGAVAAGRLDAAALQVVLPPLALAGVAVLHRAPEAGTWWRVWALGLGLSLTCALAPLLWPLAAAVLLLTAVVAGVRGSGLRLSAACLLVAVLPVLLLLPWSFHALAHPGLVLGEQGAAPHRVPATHLLTLAPGGPGTPWWPLGGAVLLVGLAGLLRRAFHRIALLAWAVALVGLLGAGVLARVRVDGSPVWPGIPLQVAALALLVAALVAAQGARGRLSAYGFGWRQPVAGALAVVAVAAPVLAATSWLVRGADDPLRRTAGSPLPAFAVADLQASPGARALLLRPLRGGVLGYTLTTGGGPTLGEAGVPPRSAQSRELAEVVADLASPRGSDAAEALALRGVQYVLLERGDEHAAIATALDAQRALVRRSYGAVELWSVAAQVPRLTVLAPRLADVARSGARAPSLEQLRADPPAALPSGQVRARATVPAGSEGRLLVLTDARSGAWRATLDGRRLHPVTAWRAAQAFELPASGGRLVLDVAAGGRHRALLVQAVLLALVLVLALPSRRRRRGLEDDLAQESAPQRELVTT